MAKDFPTVPVQIKRLPGSEDIPLPKYMTEHSVGLDLPAAVKNDTILLPGETVLIPTGLAVAIPLGYEGQVRPRSGLANKYGISVLNTPGTIDSDYRGEIGVILVNHGQEEFQIKRGDRIAQLIISPVVQAELTEVKELPDTVRSEGGFGSTGHNGQVY